MSTGACNQEQFRAIHACSALPWVSSSSRTFNTNALLLLDKLGPRPDYFQTSQNIQIFQTEFDTDEQGLFRSRFENETFPKRGWLQSIDKIIQRNFVWPVELQRREEKIRVLLCSALCKFLKSLYAQHFVCGGLFPSDLVVLIFFTDANADTNSNSNSNSNSQPQAPTQPKRRTKSTLKPRRERKQEEEEGQEQTFEVFILATDPTRFLFDATISYTTHLRFPSRFLIDTYEWIPFFSMELLQSILQGQFVVANANAERDQGEGNPFYMQADSYLLSFADLWSTLFLVSQLLSPQFNLLERALALKKQEDSKIRQQRNRKNQRKRYAKKRIFVTGPYKNWEQSPLYQAFREEEEKRLLFLAPEPVVFPVLLSFEETKQMEHNKKRRDLIDSLVLIYYKVESTFLIDLFRNVDLKLFFFFQPENKNNHEIVQTKKNAINQETNWNFEQDWKEVEKSRYSSLSTTFFGEKVLKSFESIHEKIQNEVDEWQQKQKSKEPESPTNVEQKQKKKKRETPAEATLWVSLVFLESPFLKYFVAFLLYENSKKTLKFQTPQKYVENMTLIFSFLLLRALWKPALFSTLNSQRLEKAIKHVDNKKKFPNEEKKILDVLASFDFSQILNAPHDVFKEDIIDIEPVEPLEPIESIDSLEIPVVENIAIPPLEFSFEQSNTTLTFKTTHALGDGVDSASFKEILHLWLYAKMNEKYLFLRTCSVIAPLQLLWKKTKKKIVAHCSLKFVEETNSIVRFVSSLSKFFLLLQNNPHQAASGVAFKLIRDIGLALFILHKNNFSYTRFPHEDSSKDKNRSVSFSADGIFICSKTKKEEKSELTTYFSNKEANWKHFLPVFFATLVDFRFFSLCAKQERVPSFLLDEEEAYRFFVLGLFYKKFAVLEEKRLSLRAKKDFLKKWASKAKFKTLKSFFNLEQKQSLWLQKTFFRDSFCLEDLKGWLFPAQCKNSPSSSNNSLSRKEKQKEDNKKEQDEKEVENDRESESESKNETKTTEVDEALTLVMTKKGFLNTFNHQTELDFNACYFLLPLRSSEWPSLSFQLQNLNFQQFSFHFLSRWLSMLAPPILRFSLSSQFFATLETIFRLEDTNSTSKDRQLFGSLHFETKFEIAFALTSIWFDNFDFTNGIFSGILSLDAEQFFSYLPPTEYEDMEETKENRDLVMWKWVTRSDCFNSGLLALLSPFMNFEQEFFFLSQIVQKHKDKHGGSIEEFILRWTQWMQCNFLPTFVELFLEPDEIINEETVKVDDVFQTFLTLLGSNNPIGVDSLQILKLEVSFGKEQEVPMMFFRNSASKKLTYLFSLPPKIWDHWVALCFEKDKQHLKVWRANATKDRDTETSPDEDFFRPKWQRFSLFVAPADAKENLIFDKKKKKNYVSFQKLNVFIWELLVDQGLIPFFPSIPKTNKKKRTKTKITLSQIKRIDFEDLEIRFFDHLVEPIPLSSREGSGGSQIFFCETNTKSKRKSHIVPFQQIFCLNEQLKKDNEVKEKDKERDEKSQGKTNKDDFGSHFDLFQQASTIQPFEAEFFEKGHPSLLIVGQRNLFAVVNGSLNQGNYLFLDFLDKSTKRIQKLILLPGQVLVTEDLENYFRFSARDPLTMVLIIVRISRL